MVEHLRRLAQSPKNRQDPAGHGFGYQTRACDDSPFVVALVLFSLFGMVILVVQCTSPARTLLNEQAKTDRLPAHNTLQGLLLLRSAWNLYDLFAGVALKYKRLTKLSYVLVMAPWMQRYSA